MVYNFLTISIDSILTRKKELKVQIWSYDIDENSAYIILENVCVLYHIQMQRILLRCYSTKIQKEQKT